MFEDFTTTTGPPGEDVEVFDEPFDEFTTTTAAPKPIAEELETPFTTTTAPPKTTTTTTTTPPQSIRTVTFPAGPNGQPEFATTSAARITGNWEMVGIWSDGIPLDDGFGRTLTIAGRRIGGHDACNSFSHGVIYATADGNVEVTPNRLTDQECSGTALDAYRSGLYKATRWGYTSSGNLVLANGIDVIEFAPSEVQWDSTAPIDRTLQLDSLWFGFDHVGWDSANPSGVALSFHDTAAVLEIDGCEPVILDLEIDPSGEGAVSFVPQDTSERNCDHEIAAQALDALVSANYYSAAHDDTGFAGMLIWRDDALVVVFSTPLRSRRESRHQTQWK